MILLLAVIAAAFRLPGAPNASALRNASALLRQPTAVDKVTFSDVRVWANNDYVDADKYTREMNTLHDFGVSPIVRLELRDSTMSTLIVPELEFRDLLRVEGGARPRSVDVPMADYVRNFVTSGKALVVTLATDVGLNYPVQLMHDVFGWNLTSIELPSGEANIMDVSGLAYAFEGGPPTLPINGIGSPVHAVVSASLPPGARCVYGTASFSGACVLSVVPVELGVVVLYGYPSLSAVATPEWDQVLESCAQLGRRLPVLLRENGTISGVSNTNNEPLDIYGGNRRKGNCVAWRRTLNCNPTGPRAPLEDRNCSDLIPPTESGFCECANNQLTAAATCSHSTFTCDNECGKVGFQYRDVYGEAYQPPTAQDMIAQLSDADAAFARAKRYADDAVQKVSATVGKAMKHGQNVKKFLSSQPDPWVELDAAGRESLDASAKLAHAVEVATHRPGRGANVARPTNAPWWITAPAPPNIWQVEPWWAKERKPA